MRREYSVMGRQGKLVQVLYQSVLILSPRTWPGLLVASNRNSTQTNLYIKRDFIRTPNRNTGGLMCFKQGHQASLVLFFCKLLSLHYCFSPSIVAKWSWTALGLHPTSWKPPGAGGAFFLCSLSLPGVSHVSIHEPVPALRLFSPSTRAALYSGGVGSAPSIAHCLRVGGFSRENGCWNQEKEKLMVGRQNLPLW